LPSKHITSRLRSGPSSLHLDCLCSCLPPSYLSPVYLSYNTPMTLNTSSLSFPPQSCCSISMVRQKFASLNRYHEMLILSVPPTITHSLTHQSPPFRLRFSFLLLLSSRYRISNTSHVAHNPKPRLEKNAICQLPQKVEMEYYND